MGRALISVVFRAMPRSVRPVVSNRQQQSLPAMQHGLNPSPAPARHPPGSLALRAAFHAASRRGLLKVAWLVPYMRRVNCREGALPVAAATGPPVADARMGKVT